MLNVAFLNDDQELTSKVVGAAASLVPSIYSSLQHSSTFLKFLAPLRHSSTLPDLRIRQIYEIALVSSSSPLDLPAPPATVPRYIKRSQALPFRFGISQPSNSLDSVDCC
jgi:hypothetical protein